MEKEENQNNTYTDSDNDTIKETQKSDENLNTENKSELEIFDEDLDKVVWYANMRINTSSLDDQDLANEIISQILSKYPGSS